MINLLPPQKLSNIRIARSNTVLRRYIELLSVALVLIVISLFIGNYFMNIQQTNVQKIIDEDNKKIAKLKPVQKEAEQLSSTIGTIAGLLTRDVRFSSLLEDIGGLVPQGAVLTGLQYSTDNLDDPLVISAEVDNEQTAAVLLNNIKTSDLFANAEIKSIVEIESEDDTTTTTPSTTTGDSTTDTQANTTEPAVDSPYHFTATINAYFKKDNVETKQ